MHRSPRPAARSWALVSLAALLGALAAVSSRAGAEEEAGDVPALGIPAGHRDRVLRQHVLFPAVASPWAWYIAPTQPYKHALYPPPVALEPRLGLQYNYPYAWQMGIQVPVDHNPVVTPSLGGFHGVVRSPQLPASREEAVEAEAMEAAVGLLRAGEYRKAGALLAEGYRASDDPRFPFLLAEALIGMGKHDHAALTFRHALAQEGAFDRLPEDPAGHFPSREEFEEKVRAVEPANGDSWLLRAYLMLFSREPDAGLEELLTIIKSDELPEELRDLAAALHRRYLGRAFLEPPAAPAGGAAPAPEGAGEEESP